MKKVSSSRVGKLIALALALTVSPVGLSYLIVIALVEILHIPQETASAVGEISQVVVQAIAAVMIVIQLSQDSEAEQVQSDIEAARFLFQYNQAFLKDDQMTEMERLLDKEYMDEIEGIPRTNSIITAENRQKMVNYLVYLEGLAPLVLNKTLKLDGIDDLMSYRFFLAVNNPEVQQKHLFPFADDYRGCFKLYKMWRDYRIKNGREIVQAQYSLDAWKNFELFASNHVNGALEITAGKEEDYEEIAAIMFGADPYIYPAAFGRQSIAKKVMPRLFAEENGPFFKENMYVAKSDGRVAAVLCWFDKNVVNTFPYRRLAEEYSDLPDSFLYTCEHYFETVSRNVAGQGNAWDGIYIHAFCVAVNFRRRGIGKKLLKRVISDHKDQDIYLHVLASNQSAIELYKAYGFRIVGDVEPGFSIPPEKRPDVYYMKRSRK